MMHRWISWPCAQALCDSGEQQADEETDDAYTKTKLLLGLPESWIGVVPVQVSVAAEFLRDNPPRPVGVQSAAAAKGNMESKQALKATFKRSAGRGAKKTQKSMYNAEAAAAPCKESGDSFPDYRAMGLPNEALPQKPCRGKYSYTICSSSGACVDVLLRQRAFWVKRAGGDAELPEKRHFNWNKFGGPAAAWECVALAAKW